MVLLWGWGPYCVWEINIQSNQRWYFYKIHTSLPDAGILHVEGHPISSMEYVMDHEELVQNTNSVQKGAAWICWLLFYQFYP